MRGGIGWLFGLLGAGVAAFVLTDDGDTDEHDNGGGMPPPPMTCDQGLGLLPVELRGPAAAALASSPDPNALDVAANSLLAAANAPDVPPLQKFAYARVAQCLRDRAAALRVAGAGTKGAKQSYASADMQSERLTADDERALEAVRAGYYRERA